MRPLTLVRCILLMLLVSCSDGAEHAADCVMDQGSCSKKTGQTEIIFDITPKPVKAMRTLMFAVTIKGGKSPETPLLGLSMPGMYMGKNEVLLRKSSDGTFTGTGIIPRCPSGKRLWQAGVEIPGDGRVSYTFNVNE